MNMWDYSARINDAQTKIVPEVIRALYERQQTNPQTFDSAMLELRQALLGKSFSSHTPANSAVWELMAAPIRETVDYEMERTYMLSVLFGHISLIVANQFDFEFCSRMLEARVL